MSRALIAACLVAVLPTVATPQTTPWSAGFVPPALVGLGTAVAISGGELFVGRTGEFPTFAVPPGSAGGVHVFQRDGSAWTEAHVLAADVPPGSAFGAAVAVDGAVVLVGAPQADDETGAVFVFERADGGWRLSGRLTPTSAAPGDRLGSAVALAGDIALVGAPGRGAAGTVFVFRRSNGAWRELETLAPADLPDGARFGATLVARDGRAAVGAPGPQGGFFLGAQPDYQPGAVHLYAWNGNGWDAGSTLRSADSSVRALGTALVLDGDELFASAPATNRRGAVVQFVRTGGTWRETSMIVPDRLGSFAVFGASMARTGPDLLIGAPGGSGMVGVYRRAGGSWVEAQRLTVEPRGPLVRFGEALAAEGDLAVAGAPGDDYFEGTGFVLRRRGDGTWDVEARAVDTPTMVGGLGGEQRDCTGGKVGPFDCADVDLLSYMPSSALGAARGIWISDTWGWTDPETGREIAIVGRIDGTTFVDVSDPANPVYLGELPLTEGARPNLWRDMKVYGNHTFIVADNAGRHGMQVFDLTALRSVSAPPVTFEVTTTYYGIHSAHNLAINEETGFAYTVGNSSGGETCGGHPHMVDIRNPRSPTFAGCYVINSPGTHDLQCVTYRGPDADYTGREICFSSSSTLLDIGDVTDKDAPVSVATASYPSLSYSHQGWLSDDHRYFYLNDELDEVSAGIERTRTLIFDVTDLDDPVLANEYMGETAATDHNLYVRGRYLYESNYMAGLRILDISDPVNPVEVGFFDTVPSSPNGPGFAGSWSNYPYFDSGIIVVTSIREGLFILKKRERTLVP
jgi:choice-of-anchor B domain-containing protein